MASRLRHFWWYAKSTLFTLLFHAGIIVMFAFNFDWQSAVEPGAVQPIQAQVVSEQEVEQALKKLKQREQQKEKENIAAVKKLAELVEKHKLEQQALKQLQKERKIVVQQNKRLEAQRIKAEKKRQQVAKQLELKQNMLRQAEKKRLALEAKKKKEEEIKQRRIEQAEKKRKATILKKKKAQEKLKKLEAEKKRKAVARKKREEEMRRLIESEQNQRNIKREAANALAAVREQIKWEIESNWRRPLNLKDGLSTTFEVKVTRNGTVMWVKLVHSSGNSHFDQSAEIAIKKASPLSIPTNPKYYPYINVFRFIFEPK